MKKISTFFLFVSLGVYLNAQENRQERVNLDNQPQTTTAKPKVVNTTTNGKNEATTISIRAGESQITHDRNYYENEIAKVDAQIAAINTKIEIVEANAQEKALANESGWFNDMENIKNQLEAKKQELQSHLN